MRMRDNGHLAFKVKLHPNYFFQKKAVLDWKTFLNVNEIEYFTPTFPFLWNNKDIVLLIYANLELIGIYGDFYFCCKVVHPKKFSINGWSKKCMRVETTHVLCICLYHILCPHFCAIYRVCAFRLSPFVFTSSHSPYFPHSDSPSFFSKKGIPPASFLLTFSKLLDCLPHCWVVFSLLVDSVEVRSVIETNRCITNFVTF